MKRMAILVFVAGGTCGFAQSTFSDSCGSPDWFASCTFTNACGPGQNGCLNNWFATFGCEAECPLPFPGPATDAVIPPGAITTLASGFADIHSVDVSRLFLLNGGSFRLRADSYFHNGLNWTGGGFDATSNAVRVNIPAGSPLSIFGNSGKFISAAELVLDQGTTWEDAGAISLTSGAKITNNAVFVARTDSNISFGGGTSVSFENFGTFRKLATGGTTTLGLTFNNFGTLEVLSGTLRLANNGTNFGPIELSPNTVLETAGGNYNFAGGTVVTGLGIVRDNGLLNLLGNVEIDETELTSGLNGPGDLRVVHQFNWLSGTMAGGGVTRVPAASFMTLSSTNGKNLAGRGINNQGLMTFSGPGDLVMTSAADLTNSGTIDIASDADINYGGGVGCTFNNSGTLRKSAGTGLTQLTSLTMNSSGLIDVLAGTLRLNNNGIGTGPVTLATGTVLEFIGGNFRFDAGASVIGDGLARMNGGTTLLATVPIDHSELTSSLLGPGDLIVQRDLNWISGTMSNGGVTRIPASSSMALSSTNGKNLSGRGVNNQGLMTFSGAGDLVLTSAADLTNSGMIDIASDADINYGGGLGCTFNNSGTLRKSAGTGLTQLTSLTMTSSGLIDVLTGTLRLNNNGIGSGPVTLASGTILEFIGGNFRFDAGASVTGDGLARMNGGTQMLATVPIDHAELTGGLSGPGDLIVQRDLNWISGTMSNGGATVIPAGSAISLTSNNSKNLSGRALSNSGQMTLRDNGDLVMTSAAALNNTAIIDIAGDSDINYGGGLACTFDNSGTLRKSAGTGLTQLSGLTMTSSGLIDVQAGTLRLNNNGIGTGPVTLAAGTVLEFIGGNFRFDAGAAVTGDGLARMNGGTTLLATVAIDHAELTAALSGPGDLIVQRDMNWISGTMSNGGTTVIPTGSSLSMTTNNGKNLAARSLTNNGQMAFPGSGNLNLSSAANFVNAGSLELQSDAGIVYVGGTACSLSNSGSLSKIAGAGVSNMTGYALTNTGAIDVQTGTMNISNLTQTGGSTRVASGATLQFGAAMALQGGTLRGAGAINGGVNNSAGRVQPGESAGLLAMSAAYTQGANGALDIDLGGTTPVTEYDRLTVGGAATLGGELRINLVNGFVPTAGQQFTVLTASSISGTFATVTGPGTYSASYTPTSVIVTVVTPPCMGDVNGDNQVNLSDLTVLLSHFGLVSGAAMADGDLDGDGDVDLGDLAALLGRFGSSC